MPRFRLTLVAIISVITTLALVAGCDAVKSNASSTPSASPAAQATLTTPASTSAATTTRAEAATSPAVASSPSTGTAAGSPISASAPAGVQPVAAAQPATNPSAQSVAAQTCSQSCGAETVIQVYKDWRPSVVTVISSVVQPGFRSEPQPTGTGSGFMIDNQGRILTNNHVVQDADRLDITLSDGTTMPAQIVGRDSRFDLAIIQANIPQDKLKPVQLADSDQIQVGEQAIAIGNPYGLEGTVTTGVVSSRRPVVSEPGGDGVLIDAIQTDTSINPGNSGGPLLNASGQVIGVNTLGLMPQGSPAGINFAIAINSAKKIMPDLIATGSYPHPFVGIASAEITPTLAEALNLPVKQGLLIQSVEPGSGAAQAGLQGGTRQVDVRSRQVAVGGDIITAVDGQPIVRPEQFIEYLEKNKKAGDTITLTILRNGQQQDVQVTLGQRPPEQPSGQQPSGQQPSGQQPGQQPRLPSQPPRGR
ncbi:MAG: trypsin-like peptidase domain-containing protein [Chloroflexi bacterium]|nr:trypsin-like peptidase domain-containing protein [Chloroflexota bacterium]